MEKLGEFFRNFFLANGVLWFFCSLSIVLFDFHFAAREITVGIIIPLSYAIVRLFDRNNGR